MVSSCSPQRSTPTTQIAASPPSKPNAGSLTYRRSVLIARAPTHPGLPTGLSRIAASGEETDASDGFGFPTLPGLNHRQPIGNRFSIDPTPWVEHRNASNSQTWHYTTHEKQISPNQAAHRARITDITPSKLLHCGPVHIRFDPYLRREDDGFVCE